MRRKVSIYFLCYLKKYEGGEKKSPCFLSQDSSLFAFHFSFLLPEVVLKMLLSLFLSLVSLQYQERILHLLFCLFFLLNHYHFVFFLLSSSSLISYFSHSGLSRTSTSMEYGFTVLMLMFLGILMDKFVLVDTILFYCPYSSSLVESVVATLPDSTKITPCSN